VAFSIITILQTGPESHEAEKSDAGAVARAPQRFHRTGRKNRARRTRTVMVQSPEIHGGVGRMNGASSVTTG
jgi:hypothetical protein